MYIHRSIYISGNYLMVSSGCVPGSENKLLIVYIYTWYLIKSTTYFRHILRTNSTYVQLVTAIIRTKQCICCRYPSLLSLQYETYTAVYPYSNYNIVRDFVQRCKYGMICDVGPGAAPVLFMLLIGIVFVSSNTENKQLTLFSVAKKNEIRQSSTTYWFSSDCVPGWEIYY